MSARAFVKLDAGSTKSGAARVLPFADYPQVAEVIERRRTVAKRLAADAVITPWVFCFAEPLNGRGNLSGCWRASVQSRPRSRLAYFPARGVGRCLSRGWIADRTFHDLRRSAARNFERAGIPRSVARRLGGGATRFTAATRSARRAS